MGNNAVIVDMEDETAAAVDHNYPVEEDRQLIDGPSIRIPMRFRPTNQCILNNIFLEV